MFSQGQRCKPVAFMTETEDHINGQKEQETKSQQKISILDHQKRKNTIDMWNI